MFNVDDQSTTGGTDVTNMADQLVGEGKKYKSVDDLAKAYMSIDEFVETLKAENHELKEKVTKASTIDEVIERINKAPVTGMSKDPSASTAQGLVSAEEITKLVEKTITGLETSKSRTENLKKANMLLKEAYGDKAEEVFKEVAKTPELESVYRQLAQVDPDEFIKRFVSVPKNTSAAPDTGGQAGVLHIPGSNRATIEGTKDYYDNIRKTDKARYYSQDFQIKMDRAVRNNPSLYYGKSN